MPTTYRTAPDDVVALLAAVMRKHHPDLATAGVLVGVIWAENPSGDAVKHHGDAAFATVKIVSPKDRVYKPYDAEMLVDGGKWDDLRPGQRAALLDHELAHVRLKKSWRSNVIGDDGEPTGETELKWEEDDSYRPKLKIVPGDWNGSDGFASVVSRHGGDAIEYENIAQCKARADAARREGGK
jgi:hypothetical protein